MQLSRIFEKAFNIFGEIIFYIGVIAAPYGVKIYLQDNTSFLPDFVLEALLYCFIFFFSCLEIYTHHQKKELEAENNKLRNELKESEKLAYNLRTDHEKLLREIADKTQQP